jgi:L-ascorbate metabolism protein UlaG (beta-lactamase superfamily)
MKIQWLGHACFLLQGSRSVLIDPFVPSGEVPAGPDIVAVTHGHADHLGATVEIGKLTVAMNEIAKYLDARGVPTEGMNIGGTVEVDGVSFTMTPALHSSWLEEGGEGYYGGVAAGFVIRMDGVTVYHAGDTGLFSDMKLVRELYRPDVALLPVGGRYTMGPREAMVAAEFVGAKTVIPMHYNTWPPIAQDLSEFKAAIERTTDIKVALLTPGESLEV